MDIATGTIDFTTHEFVNVKVLKVSITVVTNNGLLKSDSIENRIILADADDFVFYYDSETAGSTGNEGKARVRPLTRYIRDVFYHG